MTASEPSARPRRRFRERVVDLGQRSRQLHRQIGTCPLGQDAHVRAVDVLVREERRAPAVGHRLDLVGIAEPALFTRRGDQAAALDELCEDEGVLERIDPRRHAGRHAGGEALANRGCGHAPQRGVDLAEQRVAHDDVGDDRPQHDGDGDRGRGGEGDPAAQAHWSRRT